jgi:excisionase family DNA binding protein
MAEDFDEEVEYLTPGQVARLLHVSPKTVNRWAHEGRLPCLVTLGGHRRFRRDDVEAAVERMSQQSD